MVTLEMFYWFMALVLLHYWRSRRVVNHEPSHRRLEQDTCCSIDERLNWRRWLSSLARCNQCPRCGVFVLVLPCCDVGVFVVFWVYSAHYAIHSPEGDLRKSGEDQSDFGGGDEIKKEPPESLWRVLQKLEDGKSTWIMFDMSGGYVRLCNVKYMFMC